MVAMTVVMITYSYLEKTFCKFNWKELLIALTTLSLFGVLLQKNGFILKLDNIYKQFIHNVNYVLYINQLYKYTLGPACYEVGYNEHPGTTSTFSLRKGHFLLTSLLKKFS